MCFKVLESFFILIIYGTDYRRIPRTLSHVYYDPISEDNKRELDKIWKAYTSDPSDPVVTNRKLETWGRILHVPESTSTVAKFSFDNLCGKPLSAADYLEITKNFSTIFLVDVPKMGLERKDLVCFFYDLIPRSRQSNSWFLGPKIHYFRRRMLREQG